MSNSYIIIILKKTTYSQTGCSFAGNFANFRRNVSILIDSLLRASCNLREQVPLSVATRSSLRKC